MEMEMELTDIQIQIIEGFQVACDEGDVVIFPIKDKKTGNIHPCLAVSLPDDIIVPIGILFTPHQDDLSKYKFPDGLEEVDSIGGVNFVYNDTGDDEEDETPQPGFFARLKNLKNRLLNR